MREVTIYIANDGKQFNDEYECRLYEINLLKDGADFVMLDHNEEKTDDPQDCYFINIRNQKALDYFTAYEEWEGLRFPSEIGSFYYLREYDDWFPITDNIKELEEKLAF